MLYAVGLLFKPGLEEADLKDVVRATDIEDAITVFMKGRNVKYAYAAYAYPAKKKRYGYKRVAMEHLLFHFWTR